MVPINLNAICCNFIYKNLAKKTWELCMHLVYDHFYIPLTSKSGKFQSQTIIFFVEPTVVLVKNSEKNTSKLWRSWSLALQVHNFLSHLHLFKVGEIMLLKYGTLMLAAGHILDLYRIAPFYENYTKLYFDAKHLKKRLNRDRGKFLVPLFQKKCLFWPILNAGLNF